MNGAHPSNVQFFPHMSSDISLEPPSTFYVHLKRLQNLGMQTR